MDSTIQNIIIDLKIISMLEPKGKLCMINGVLAVEAQSIWVPVKRYIYNNNRQSIFQRIKQRILELENLFSHKHICDGWIKNEFASLMEPVKLGLHHLKETYIEDSQLCANLDLIISRLNNIQNQYIEKK